MTIHEKMEMQLVWNFTKSDSFKVRVQDGSVVVTVKPSSVHLLQSLPRVLFVLISIVTSVGVTCGTAENLEIVRCDIFTKCKWCLVFGVYLFLYFLFFE